ncbi:MAG: lipoate--protein ligase family protein [Bacteroidetes bacterium]|nr:lipoate--protein ligase family protein [Bacteroidota bacterium]
MPIRWIDAGTVSYLRSQSIYHGLGYAQERRTPDTIVLATPESPYLCVGHFQDPARELDLEFCRKSGLPVIRRETGGGTVLIDSGQLFVQWVFQRESLPRKVEQRFETFIKPIVETYSFFGIDAKLYPVNDIHVNGRKICGTGAGTIGEAEVVTGNFLFDFDTEKMVQALNLPGEVFREQTRESLNKYLTTFGKEKRSQPDRKEVIEVYMAQCRKALGRDFFDGNFTEKESKEMVLIEEKWKEEAGHFIPLSRPEERLLKIHAGVWIGQMKHAARGGFIESVIRMNENRIEFIKLKADAGNATAKDWNGLETSLTGAVLEREQLSDRLAKYFSSHREQGGFHIDDWVEALLRIRNEKKRVTGRE